MPNNEYLMKMKKPLNVHLAISLLIVLGIPAILPGCMQVSEENNKEEVFLKTNLISEAPKSLEPTMEFIASQMSLSDLKYASLETGIDSVSIYFGSMKQFDNPGHWISLAINDSILSWSTVPLPDTDTLEFPSNNVDLNFDNGTKRISLCVMHNPDTNEVFYTWLQQGEIINHAQIVNIDTPIQINHSFPDLEVSLLSEGPLKINDLSGKYVVINWWHTGCGPCVAAIPGLNQLVTKYKDHPDVEFIAIAADSKERVEGLLERKEFKFLQSLGNKESTGIFGESFPKYVIVNPEGVVTYLASGGSENSHEGIDRSLSQQIETTRR